MRLRFASLPLLLTLLLPTSALADPTPPHSPASLDRSTPRRAVDSFLRATHAGNFDLAASALDLRGMSPQARSAEAPQLARELATVLDRPGFIHPARISDEPDGSASDGADIEIIASARADGHLIPLSLVRVREGSSAVWLFSRPTIAALPSLLTAAHQPWLASVAPEALAHTWAGLALWQWVGLLLSAVLAALFASLTSHLFVAALSALARRTLAEWDGPLIDASRKPIRFLLSVVFFELAASQLSLPQFPSVVVDHLVYTGLTIGFAWFVLRLVNAGAGVVEGRLPEDTAGELRAREVRTRLAVARRVGSLLTLCVAAAILLVQFEVVRSFGLSLLASAGVASVVIGFAAQKSLSGIIAGIQISLAQPVRIGDLVQFENELGNIEEINLTHVVMKLWDERRLVIPITKFVDASFQNWSKIGLQILGTVTVHADQTVPVPLVRTELERLCKAHKSWDGRMCKLQVVDADARTITLRALVSVAKVDDLFDFRCDVREGLVDFLQRLDGGSYLPRVRFAPLETPPPRA